MLTISDGLPIQWVLAGKQSFNQKEYPHVQQVPFYQKAKCATEQRVVITDDEDNEYFIRVYNCDGVQIGDDLDLIKTSIVLGEDEVTQPDNNNFDGSEDPWTTDTVYGSEVGAPTWEWTVTGMSVNVPDGEVSGDLLIPFTIVKGCKYTFRVTCAGNNAALDAGAQLRIYARNSISEYISPLNSNVIPNGPGELVFELIAQEDCDQIFLTVASDATVTGYTDCVVSLVVLEGVEYPGGTYTLDFTPQVIGICDISAMFKLFKRLNGITNGTFQDTLAPSQSVPGNPNAWTWNANDAVTTIPNSFTPTQSLRIPFNTTAGENYEFDLNLDVVDGGGGAGNYTRLILYLTDGVSFGNSVQTDLPLGASNWNPAITATADWPYIQIIALATNAGGFGRQVRLHDIASDQETFEEVAFTDYVEFSEDIDWTLLRYKANSEVAGIPYTGSEPYFNIFLPMQFFHDRIKVEMVMAKLSGGKKVNTGGGMNQDRKMILDFMPPYMHAKMSIIMQHVINGEVIVDELQWLLNEDATYEYVEPEDETYPMKGAVIYWEQQGYAIDNLL